MSKNGKTETAAEEAAIPKRKPQKTSEYLRYDFTEAEFLDHARTLSRVNQELERFLEEKKRVTASLTSTQKDKEAAVSSQSTLVSNGYEYRNVDCELHYDMPIKGKKTLIRLDAGEIVKVSFMDGAEMQEPLPLEEPKEDPSCTIKVNGEVAWSGTSSELTAAAERLKGQ